MFDTTTKKRIDDCRDILVGKITATDKQIDQFAYQLYNLTEQEIKIVEEQTHE